MEKDPLINFLELQKIKDIVDYQKDVYVKNALTQEFTPKKRNIEIDYDDNSIVFAYNLNRLKSKFSENFKLSKKIDSKAKARKSKKKGISIQVTKIPKLNMIIVDIYSKPIGIVLSKKLKRYDSVKEFVSREKTLVELGLYVLNLIRENKEELESSENKKFKKMKNVLEDNQINR